MNSILDADFKSCATGKTHYTLKALESYYHETGKVGLLVVSNEHIARIFKKKFDYINCVGLDCLEDFIQGKEPTIILYDNSAITELAMRYNKVCNENQIIRNKINDFMEGLAEVDD